MGADLEVGEGLRGYWTPQEKRLIVEQTLSSGLSVASVAREHGVNANQEALPSWAVGDRWRR